MSVIGGAFGNIPGLDSAYTTYENAFSWNDQGKGRGLILPFPILATAVDAGASPTWRLRPGLVLGKITSTGKLKQYDPTATDGSQIATGVLMQGLAMQDPFSGTTRDKFLGVLVSGPVRGAALYGLDQKARGDMKCQGFIFDDDPHGAIAVYRVQEIAAPDSAGTLTITAATYPNGSHLIFTSQSVAGAFTVTLPAAAAGLRYRFTNMLDQNMTVAAPTADTLVTRGDTAADSIVFSTASNKIGAEVDFISYYVGSSTYKWFATNRSDCTMTINT